MSTNANVENKANPVQQKNSGWKRLLKIGMWSIVALFLLVLGLLQVTVSVLTPERLTPLTEKLLSKSLNADVSVKRVELTVWKTFPKITLEIDSLAMESRALNGIEDSVRAKLPNNSDSLLALKYFRGGVNLHELVLGKISLYDIQLHEPMVNLVAVDSITANYNIVPPSTPESEEDTAQISLPRISIDHFAIIDAKPIRYFSLADSLDITLNLKTVDFNGVDDPKYVLDFQGNVASPLLGIINLKESPFVVNGGLEWDQSSPTVISLKEFTAGADIIISHINGEFDFGNDMKINNLSLSLDPIKYEDIKERVPQEYASLLKDVATNASFEMDMQLSKPFRFTKEKMPWAEVNLRVPDCYLNYGELKADKFTADVKATLKGENIDDAIVEINNVHLNGMGVDCSLSTTLSSIITDPLVDGKFKGMMNLRNLPPFIVKMIDGRLRGELNADAQFHLRQSHLSRNNFHKAILKGEMSVKNFDFHSNDTLIDVYARNTQFNLGTSESFVRNNHRVDSLLTASVKVDTCAFHYDGYNVRMNDFKAGVGCANTASSIDSTQVNPISATMRVGRLSYRSEADTMRVRLRDAKCMASLRRFKELEKVPQLMLRINAGSAGASTKELRVNLRESAISITAHLKPRRKMSPQVKTVFERIVKENPTISNDSAYALARREVRASRKARSARMDSIESEISTIDFGVDRSTRALLNQWDVKGKINAKSARVFTPYFPLRNRISDVDIQFTTDSVAFNSMKYKGGRSNFSVNGSISNIKRALSGRGNQPLKMAFILRSDTIDVNQLAEAVFAGSAYSEKVAASSSSITSALENIEDESQLEAVISQQAETQESGALLVPMNIDAIMRVTAKNIIYSDMLMHNMSGNVQIYRGSLRFDQLRASTDMGSVNLSALYSAPTKKDMSFGFGVEIKDFYIDRFLDLMPAVDTIMPLLKDISGIINADVAATVDVDTAMNLVLPSLNAAIKLEGDSLVLLDAETFKTISKWLLFKDKKKNMVDKMSVEVLVKDSQMELFPFMFNIDRYQLGVLGYNDLAMNFNYHVSVLKSPIPFKFGINVKGDPDNMKVRLGRAKFKEKMVAERVAIVDTTRVNLLRQIENVFRRGVDRSSKLNLGNTTQKIERFEEETGDTISHADSLLFIQEGLLPAPPAPEVDSTEVVDNKKKRDKKKR